MTRRPRTAVSVALRARQKNPSEWIKAQPAFVGAQGKLVFDHDVDNEDGGRRREKAALPTE